MKFSQVQEGRRAIRRVPLPLVNHRCAYLPDLPELAEQRKRDAEAAGTTETPPAPEVGLRVLIGSETAALLQRAAEFARARGSKDPRPGDPLYDFGECVHRVLLAAVDPDSDPSNPEPFFDSMDQLLNSEHIGQDGIILLSEQQVLWQDLCSPQALTMGADAVWDSIGRMAAADAPDFFESLRPGLRWILARTMANLLFASQTGKLPLGAGSSENGTATKNESESETKP